MLTGGYKETLQPLNTRQQHAFHRNKALEPLWHFVAHMSTAGREVNSQHAPVLTVETPPHGCYIEHLLSHFSCHGLVFKVVGLGRCAVSSLTTLRTDGHRMQSHTGQTTSVFSASSRIRERHRHIIPCTEAELCDTGPA